MVRWSWVNLQFRGVLLVWIRVGQGPTALAVGAGGSCLDIFTLSLWETTRYRLKDCLKGSLNPKTSNNQIFTSDEVRNDNLWSCQKVYEALTFLVDNIYIRFGFKLYRQIKGIPKRTYCAPLAPDLFCSVIRGT